MSQETSIVPSAAPEGQGAGVLPGAIAVASFAAIAATRTATAQTAPPIRHRDPETEKVVVMILTDRKARMAFLDDRCGFLDRFMLPVGARNDLLQISDDRINGAAQELDFNFGDAAGKTEPCQVSTLADLFCDQ